MCTSYNLYSLSQISGNYGQAHPLLYAPYIRVDERRRAIVFRFRLTRPIPIIIISQSIASSSYGMIKTGDAPFPPRGIQYVW